DPSRWVAGILGPAPSLLALPLGGGNSPQPDRLVLAPRRQDLAVGAEGHRGDRPGVPLERGRVPATPHVPQPDRPVATPRAEGLAVGAERHRPDKGGVPLEGPPFPAGPDVPQPYRFVHAPRGEGPPVGAERHGQDP